MSDQKPTVQDRIAQLQADQEKIEKLEHDLERAHLDTQEWINKYQKLRILLLRIKIPIEEFTKLEHMF
jgi:hypothetical protein